MTVRETLSMIFSGGLERCVTLLMMCAAGVTYGQTPSRYRELKAVVNNNTGFAHLTRGVNMFTLQYRDTLSPGW